MVQIKPIVPLMEESMYSCYQVDIFVEDVV